MQVYEVWKNAIFNQYFVISEMIQNRAIDSRHRRMAEAAIMRSIARQKWNRAHGLLSWRKPITEWKGCYLIVDRRRFDVVRRGVNWLLAAGLLQRPVRRCQRCSMMVLLLRLLLLLPSSDNDGMMSRALNELYNAVSVAPSYRRQRHTKTIPSSFNIRCCRVSAQECWRPVLI